MLAQTLAASAGGGGGASLMTFLLPVLLILVFWLLLIRPQRKRQREMAEMQQRLEVGQEVMTGAGIMGTIKSVEDDVIVLELSPGVTARFVRQAILRVVDSEEAGSESAPEKTSGEETSGQTTSDDLPPTHNEKK